MEPAVNEPEDLPTNWGRWGEDDERGTLNLITDEVRARAVAEARTGRTVSLARATPTAPMVAGPTAPGGADSISVLQAPMFIGGNPQATAEVIVMTPHSVNMTHFDAPVHIVVDGAVYPGVPLEDAYGPAGIRHGSTTIFGDGVVTRGVLLDLAWAGPLPEGHGVSAAELDLACERAGVEMRGGDALVVRGGWDHAADPRRRMPGMTLEAVAWMARHDVAVYAGDIGDVFPPLDTRLPTPLHRVGLARLGMPLIDIADPTDLAAACADEGRATFLFVAAPPRLGAASGVPVNPLAIF
ncbi:cyclase family protein [Nocardia terpenica]|nr:cyclase family protein [Nocardia terpenica]MBF6105306.1 cyclase family protein [Nocardia terpenica]MBF6113224.1 cyclase family protein [Nocardia terpenica]MBF6119354.1 cyclase family protein [Nocardia terpenica]MBF6153002.1 cyclase family protein [Nocardia terpenica]